MTVFNLEFRMQGPQSGSKKNIPKQDASLQGRDFNLNLLSSDSMTEAVLLTLGRSWRTHLKKLGLRPKAYVEAEGMKFCKFHPPNSFISTLLRPINWKKDHLSKPSA